MSIRAVDMMVVYSKTSDVEKAQQVEQQQGRVTQQQIAAEEIKNKEIKQTQVNQANRDDETGRIREHPERKRGKKTGAQDQGDTQQEGDTEQKQDSSRGKPRVSSHVGKIDIRI
jgi:hypothetical protein